MLARAFALTVAFASALATSQLPEFAQQYRQRLGGAIDELRRVMATFDDDAARTGLDRPAALDRLRRSPDAFVQRRGESMSATAGRLAALERQRQDMDAGGPLVRVMALADNLDRDVATAAWRSFEPGVPATGEGAMLAGAGFVGGWGAAALLSLPFRRRRLLA